MNKMDKVKKKYDEYIKEFKEQQDCGKVPMKAKPLTLNDFIPDSYKY